MILQLASLEPANTDKDNQDGDDNLERNVARHQSGILVENLWRKKCLSKNIKKRAQ